MPNVSMKKMSDVAGSLGVNSANAAGEESQIELIKRKVNQFTVRHGRRPRVLVSQIGPRGQRRALNQVASIFARWGFDVDIGSICQLPHQAALMAIENDVHMVCLLCDPAQQSQMGSELIDALIDYESDAIMVAFFGDTHTGGIRRQAPSEQFGPVFIRPAAAEADIISILDKIS
jgi:methylmalonyl-CoA mutase